MKYALVGATLLLGACASTLPATGVPEYVWIGCHEVTENPGGDGSVAFGPFGVKTEYIFFKQVSADGSVGPITTSKPCGE